MRHKFSPAYWWGQRVLRSLLGSKIEEWRFRHRDRADVRCGFSNVSLPHRKWLVDRLLSDNPVDLLEVGCGWGPNLEVLAGRAPGLRLTGVDISPASVAEGRTRFAPTSPFYDRVWLMEGRADDLSGFGDMSVDIVFTDALLIYIAPDKIERCIREMMRVARQRVVLLELHESRAGARGRYTRDGWIRDFEALLYQIAGQAAVTLTPLPPELRSAGRWPEFGMLIDVNIKKAFAL